MVSNDKSLIRLLYSSTSTMQRLEISTHYRFEISKQTNAKAEETNLKLDVA